jgi:hypothetical protein
MKFVLRQLAILVVSYLAAMFVFGGPFILASLFLDLG